MQTLQTALTARESRAPAFLEGGHTILEAARLADCSHGTVYRAMCKSGTRRNEAQIRARERRSQADRLAILEAAIAQPGTAQRMDVMQFLRETSDGCAQAVISSPPFNRICTG